jgi:hypothetical protein
MPHEPLHTPPAHQFFTMGAPSKGLSIMRRFTKEEHNFSVDSTSENEACHAHVDVWRIVGEQRGFFASEKDAIRFCDEITHTLIEKMVFFDVNAGYEDLRNENYVAIDHPDVENLARSGATIRVTTVFMDAVVENHAWQLRSHSDGAVVKTVMARDVWEAIMSAQNPSVQFDSTISEWNTCPKSGRIE